MQDFFHTWDILVIKSFPNHSRSGNTWLPSPGAAITLFNFTKETLPQSLQGRPEGLQGVLRVIHFISDRPKFTYSVSCQKGGLSENRKIPDLHLPTDSARDIFITSSDLWCTKTVLMQQLPISLRNNFIPVDSLVISVCISRGINILCIS